jgi:6-hydroxycyclohex-1-ene-1-carbonyl-CoA dehydrogenase
MKAVRLTAADAPLELLDVPVPEPAEEQVVVKVAGCGVCHTDIGFWRDGVPTRHALPLTLGHEISGVVTDAAPEHRGLLGREVIVPSVIPCGTCDLDGGFADFLAGPGRGLCPVEERGGYDLADLSVIADAVTTPFQAVVRSGLQPGDLAIVVGAGGVGGYAIQIAAALGARVVAIDVDDAKLEAIQPHGASVTLNSRSIDFRTLKKEIGAHAKSWGCPEHGWKIFECSGSPGGQETAFGLLGYAGVLLVIGFTLAKIEVRLSNLMAFDATVQGSWGCRPELYPEALRLVTSGRVTLRPFVERHALSNGPEILRRVADHEIHKRAVLVPAGPPSN